MTHCVDSSFDFFSRPPVDVSLEDVHDQEIFPLSTISGDADTIEFLISGDSDEYTDLSETRLHLKMKITKKDGTAVASDKVKLVKYFPSALFRQCDLYLNGTLVTTSSSMYPYLSYITSELSFNKGVKDDQLNVLEYAKGLDVTADNAEPEAFVRLNLPLCNQNRLIPNGVHMTLRLLRSAQEFVLIKAATTDNEDYKISITKASLFVRRIKPAPNILLEHADTFSKMNAVFPIVRVWPKFFTLQQGTKEFDLANIVQGELPARVIIGLVSTEAFSGSTTSDPFKFEHFNLIRVHLNSNGRAIPAVPITCDFSKNHFKRAYNQLLDTVQGPCQDSESIGLTGHNFKDSSCFLAFTIARTFTGQQASVPQKEQGYLNCKLLFNNTLTKNVNAIICLEYHNTIEIDSARNIYLDYSA